VGAILFKIWVENYVWKESPKWFDFPFLKRRKEVKEDPHLVANGRRRRWFQCLEVNGWKKRRFFFTSSHFSSKQLHLDLRFFPFNIKVLFYHGCRPLFMHFLFFPWPINYDCTFWCHKSPTYSLSIWFSWKYLLCSLKLWRCIWPCLTGLKLRKWMKSQPRSHL